MLADQLHRVHPPSHAWQACIDEGLRRGKPMRRASHIGSENRTDPAILQSVLLVECQRGSLGNRIAGYSVGKIPGDEIRRCGCAIAKSTKRGETAALYGFGQGSDSGDDAPPLQPFGGVILIIGRNVEAILRCSAEMRNRSQKPGAKTIGVGRYMKRNALSTILAAGQSWQFRQKLSFEHADLLNVTA